MAKLTTEQAIDCLRRYDTEYYTPQCRQAHRMAIEALELSRWISVAEQMPKEDEHVLAWTAHGDFCESAFWNGSYWVKTWSHDDISGVTHWKPLPEPPGKDVIGGA